MRRGSMTVELIAAIGTLGVLGRVVVGAIRDRAAIVRLERRAADLEIARDLCAALRHGEKTLIPAGWKLTRTIQNGMTVVTVDGPEQVHLTTFLTEIR